MLPEIKLSKFGIVFNSSVSFDDGGEIMLDWQENNGVYTACANGTWRLEKENLTNGARVKISAVLDKIYDKVEFRYFNIDSIAADHILPQSCFKGCKSRNLKLVEEPESLWGESVISITRDGVTLQLSTPYQAGFPAVYTATAKKQLLEDNRITSLVEFYGSTEFEFPALSVRESSDGYSMLNDYADENSIKGRKFADPVCGWNTWDYYRWTITEDEVLKNAEFIAKDPVLSKYVKRIIIDDGWQYCYGEWEPNHYFPSGMQFLARELRKMNFVPGLWFAPGIVEPHARIAQLDSDMLACSKGGQPCLTYQCMKRYGFVLDPTTEKAQKFLEDTFRKYTDYGYEYFKIDFLRATTEAYRRKDPLCRRDDIVRLIVDGVRRGTGDKAEILGCGYVYSSGSQGINAARIGADIHATWNNLKSNAPSVAARYWQNRKLWINDPDFAVCRADHTSNDPDLHSLRCCYVYVNPEDPFLEDKYHDLATFSPGEPEVLLSVAIISGGVINLSDKMTLLNETGLELCRKTVAAEPGEAGVALDLFSEELPGQIVQKFKSGIRLLAINWQDSGNKLFSFDLEKCGISKDMKAVDFWSGEKLSHDGKLLQIELAPHRCKLIEFR